MPKDQEIDEQVITLASYETLRAMINVCDDVIELKKLCRIMHKAGYFSEEIATLVAKKLAQDWV